MSGHVVDDYEITRVRMVGGRDQWGRSRVWICEPLADGDDSGKWTVMYRPDASGAFPVKVQYEPSFEAALRFARSLVTVYEAERSTPSGTGGAE